MKIQAKLKSEVLVGFFSFTGNCMMWGEEEEEQKEATWEEYSVLFKDFYRHMTFSEYDRPENNVVFIHEHEFSEVNGSESDPLSSVISNYTIHTHKGNKSNILYRKCHLYFQSFQSE